MLIPAGQIVVLCVDWKGVCDDVGFSVFDRDCMQVSDLCGLWWSVGITNGSDYTTY